MKADRAATEAAGFADARSYVRPTGEEVLYGKDWHARKLELWARCGGRCEFRQTDAWWMGEIRGGRCKSAAEHPHHKIKRSISRDDRMENLMALCFFHHQQQHPEKQTRFGEGRGESAESAK